MFFFKTRNVNSIISASSSFSNAILNENINNNNSSSINSDLSFYLNNTNSNDLDGVINWQNIFFVRRDPIIRNIQLIIAIYGLLESCFYFYLSYNVLRDF